MDAGVKQLIDGFKMGVDAQSAMISDRGLLADIREVIGQMEAVAAEPGMDMMKFQERLNADGLMARYGDAMAKLAEAQAAGLEQKIAEVDEAAAAAGPVDLETLDIADVEVAVAPHRQVYNTTVRDNDALPHQKAAYEALFALAAECKTIPEFNRRAKAGGHLEELGLSAAWDQNVNTFRLEINHRQPDMMTYALDALAAVRDQPFPETLAYALSRLALLNERTMALRQSRFEPANAFAGELMAYLVLVHTEEQRQKVANLHELMAAFAGEDIDGALAHPYFRQLLTIDDGRQRGEYGPDYLGIAPFLRAGWFADAALTPEEKKGYAERKEVPRPPASPYPYRTGAIGGVDLTLAEPPFASPLDEPYGVTLTLANGAAESRALDVRKGLRLWVFAEEGVTSQKVKADVPAELGPGEKATLAGDLFAWGLPAEERLFAVAFDVGVAGDFGCDLAAKYAEPKGLPPQFIPNFYLEPFDGGAATEPAFVMPHRPLPPYPFPIPIK